MICLNNGQLARDSSRHNAPSVVGRKKMSHCISNEVSEDILS